MKRTTITLTDDLAVAVAREARRRRVSVSEITRQALTSHLGLANGEPRRFSIFGLGSSGRTDTAENIEEILAAEWDRDFDRDR